MPWILLLSYLLAQPITMSRFPMHLMNTESATSMCHLRSSIILTGCEVHIPCWVWIRPCPASQRNSTQQRMQKQPTRCSAVCSALSSLKQSTSSQTMIRKPNLHLPPCLYSTVSILLTNYPSTDLSTSVWKWNTLQWNKNLFTNTVFGNEVAYVTSKFQPSDRKLPFVHKLLIFVFKAYWVEFNMLNCFTSKIYVFICL